MCAVVLELWLCDVSIMEMTSVDVLTCKHQTDRVIHFQPVV